MLPDPASYGMRNSLIAPHNSQGAAGASSIEITAGAAVGIVNRGYRSDIARAAWRVRRAFCCMTAV